MDDGQAELLSCPFCSFTDSDAYFLTQHVELCHPENGHSPFIADQESSSEAVEGDAGAREYIDCPRGCGEIVLGADLPSHLNLHAAEDIAFEDEEAEVRQYEETPPDYEDDFDRAPEHLDEEDSLRLHKGLSKVRHRHDGNGKHGFHESTSLSTVQGGKAKRLGVLSFPLYPINTSVADSLYSVQSLVLMHTRSRCPRGSVKCWRTGQVSFA